MFLSSLLDTLKYLFQKVGPHLSIYISWHLHETEIKICTFMTFSTSRAVVQCNPLAPWSNVPSITAQWQCQCLPALHLGFPALHLSIPCCILQRSRIFTFLCHLQKFKAPRTKCTREWKLFHCHHFVTTDFSNQKSWTLSLFWEWGKFQPYFNNKKQLNHYF